MEVSRRDFMKFSVPALCLPLVSKLPGSITSLGGAPALSARNGGKAILYDSSKCNGCRACEVVCRRANRLAPLPQQGPQLDLSPNSWTVVKTTEVVVNGKAEKATLRLQCLHCTDATCVKVCSTGTLRHNEVTASWNSIETSATAAAIALGNAPSTCLAWLAPRRAGSSRCSNAPCVQQG